MKRRSLAPHTTWLRSTDRALARGAVDEERLLEQTEARKYLVLLLTVASTIVVQPLAHGFLAGLMFSDVLRNLLVVTVLFVVFQRRHVRLVSLLIGLPVMASNWAHYTLPERFELALAVIHHAFLVAFLGFAAAVILRRIFERKVVRGDDVIGAICGYLLAGIAWGSLYLLVELLVPGSFSVHQAIAGQLGVGTRGKRCSITTAS